jgi:secreted trypsin-like serine protease
MRAFALSPNRAGWDQMQRSVGVVVAVAIGLLVTVGAAAAQASARAHTRTQLARVERPLIIGGTSAEPGSFPMMAFVIYDAGVVDYLCSGTVISSNVVLTAGHCGESTATGIVDAAANYTVVTGNVDWAASAGRQLSGVSQVILNPGFNPSTLDDDAALLVLSTPTTAPPVQLASNPADLWLLDAGNAETLAGWGATVSGGGAVQQLQWADTVVQSPASCAGQAAGEDADFDANAQLCVLDPPTNADGPCHGDSGGPLLADDDGTNVQVGIVSFGPDNCSSTQAGFLTRADAISSWADSWAQAVAPVPTPGPTVAPTTAPTAVPSTSPAPAPAATALAPPATPTAIHEPEAGRYVGETSQGLPIRLRVADSRKSINAVKLSFRLSCSRRSAPSYNYTPPIRGADWTLDKSAAMGFGGAFRDATGEQYRLTGRFTESGSATGTLATRWRSRRYGSCSSGTVTWHATRAG